MRSAFFDDAVGWVPVDASVASLWKVDAFGRDEGDFLTTHVDEGIDLPSPHWGDIKSEWMQGIDLRTVGGTWGGATWTNTLSVTSQRAVSVAAQQRKSESRTKQSKADPSSGPTRTP